MNELLGGAATQNEVEPNKCSTVRSETAAWFPFPLKWYFQKINEKTIRINLNLPNDFNDN